MVYKLCENCEFCKNCLYSFTNIRYCGAVYLHCKKMIKAGLNAELDGQAGIQELAGDATMLYYFLDEAQEGGKAFLEKRKPNFDKYPKMP